MLYEVITHGVALEAAADQGLLEEAAPGGREARKQGAGVDEVRGPDGAWTEAQVRHRA